MQDQKRKEGQRSNDIHRELDKNKTLNDPGKDVVDYGRSEHEAVEESKGKDLAGGKERGRDK